MKLCCVDVRMAEISQEVLQGLDTVAQAKLRAAYAAVDNHVKDGQVVGIGSGSTVVFAVQRLAQRVRDENLRVICIPTSFQARQLILENKLVLGDLNANPVLDVAIDGADEVSAQLDCIKGGGGCLLQEKIVASNAEQLIIIADYSKIADYLGSVWKKGVPLEVIADCYVPIMRKLEKMGGKPVLRMAKAKAGPCVTDNGNFIVDCDFGVMQEPAKLEQRLLSIPGLVETGFFLQMAVKAYFGMQDGSVKTLDAPARQ